MKRTLVILLAVCFTCANASAQWFLFPGAGKNGASTEIAQTVTDTLETAAPAVDSLVQDDVFILDRPEVINVALMLPFNSRTNPDPKFMEMYSGALLALRDLGNSGAAVNLNVIDFSDAGHPVTEEVINANDVIIGPVTVDEIRKAYGICSNARHIVSPLDPKTAALVDSLSIIQAPSPWMSQYDGMVEWISEDMKFGDKLFVVTDSGKAGTQSLYLMDLLWEKGIPYSEICTVKHEYGIIGRSLFVICSDSEGFINNAIREIDSMSSSSRSKVVLFTTSKARNASLDPRTLYRTNAHMTAAYHIDYDDLRVKDFILKYRALFNAEPGSFAFQGYDALHYFTNICRIYGRMWFKKLPEYSERGLQADFKFVQTDKPGLTNTAVRRIVYNKDMTTTLF